MPNENEKGEMCEKEFLALTTEEIRRIVEEKNKPYGGVFLADGTRRLTLCKTRLFPDSDEFYRAYADQFVESFKESLKIFFGHGLRVLFFPLFGPSVLQRKDQFKKIAIPQVYRGLFQSEEISRFYQNNSIRVKAYGDLSKLEMVDNHHPKMAEGIEQAIEKTSSHSRHTVYFGFMSDNTPGLEMPQMIIDFYKTNNRPPTHSEMITAYYGEAVPTVDFFIMSGKISDQAALPPIVNGLSSKMYYFPVPGFMGFTVQNYRRILYNLLFVQKPHSAPGYSKDALMCIDTMDDYFNIHKDTIIGTQKRIGEFLVSEL